MRSKQSQSVPYRIVNVLGKREGSRGMDREEAEGDEMLRGGNSTTTGRARQMAVRPRRSQTRGEDT